MTRPRYIERRRNNAATVTEVALDGKAGYDESATINYRDTAAGSERDTRLILDSGADAILITGD